VPRAKEQIEVENLEHWKLVKAFRKRLAKVQARRKPREKRPGGPERKLLEKDYLSLILFSFFNPVVDSMRGLCQASNLKRVQEEICTRPVSLGSFSEAQSVFDPEVPKEVFADLFRQIPADKLDPRLKKFGDRIQIVDGSLLRALPRMFWALWVDEKNRAAKLHLKFSARRLAPSAAVVTVGKACERENLLNIVEKGEIVVCDRGYGLDYSYFGKLRSQGVSFVIRIRNNPRKETVEELELSEADRAAGVVWQGRVKLGGDWQGEALRLVQVEAEGKKLMLVTYLDIEAELVALLYRYRWQIELFFKWLKCILGCRHLLAESPKGVSIQVYCALIAALMLQILTGRRPDKRAMELIQFYVMGYAELDEVVHLLGIEKTK